MQDSEIKFGQRVRCRVTGFTGIVDGIIYCLNVAKRASVQPEVGADGKMPEGYYIDVCNLIETAERKFEAEEVTPKFELGSKVRCKITEVEGVVTEQKVMVNGCVGYGVLRKFSDSLNMDIKNMRPVVIMENCLELVAPPSETHTPKTTGCNHEKVERY